MNIAWADGTHVSVDPREAYQALVPLYRDGGLDPDEVIRIAKDPASPLHAEFEWDMELAARAHWRDRACLIIRSLRVDGAPAFVRVSVERPAGAGETRVIGVYVAPRDVPDRTDQALVLLRIERELHGHAVTLRTLSAIWGQSTSSAARLVERAREQLGRARSMGVPRASKRR